MATIVEYDSSTRWYTRVHRDDPALSEDEALDRVEQLNRSPDARLCPQPPYAVRSASGLIRTDRGYMPTPSEVRVDAAEKRLTALFSPVQTALEYLLAGAITVGAAWAWYAMAASWAGPSPSHELAVSTGIIAVIVGLHSPGWTWNLFHRPTRRLIERLKWPLSGQRREVVEPERERRDKAFLAHQMAEEKARKEAQEAFRAECTAMVEEQDRAWKARWRALESRDFATDPTITPEEWEMIECELEAACDLQFAERAVRVVRRWAAAAAAEPDMEDEVADRLEMLNVRLARLRHRAAGWDED